MQNTEGKRRSKRWYWLAALPMAAAIAAVVLNVLGMLADVRDMPRLVAPGERTLELAAGDYVAYGERSSVVGGVRYSSSVVSPQCAVTDAATGAPIELRRATTTTYVIPDHRGEAVFAFTTPRAGTYRLACESNYEPLVIAVGQEFFFRRILTMIVAMFLGLVGTTGAVVLIHRWGRRRSARLA